jgi:hypothetical protein
VLALMRPGSSISLHAKLNKKLFAEIENQAWLIIERKLIVSAMRWPPISVQAPGQVARFDGGPISP